MFLRTFVSFESSFVFQSIDTHLYSPPQRGQQLDELGVQCCSIILPAARRATQNPKTFDVALQRTVPES